MLRAHADGRMRPLRRNRGAENVFSRASRLASGADEPDFVGADAIADGSLRTAGGKGRIAHPKTTLRSDGMQ